MMWFFAILIVLAMGGIAVLAAGKGTPLADVYDDRPDVRVPAVGPLTGADLRRVRFSLAFRGYRMSEVDALLERLATEREAAETREAAAARTHETRDVTGHGDQGERPVSPERRGDDAPD
jgi:DivIVA domain-containing protein